ncbi:CMP-N-acetylneuraminate-beta-galactosamide-alpha-2,3-sialyltransferase 1 [Lates calcarifer]|uniref:CMP-N-acetylneuraminate-beta-galactosamide- alpha-2,3-sialyltransferase 1 n=1 Tax=Lates calcarifer TaxID=8187 RepID=A0AAJ7VJB5_LATCA|nr:CMP-N-acetylneuraminate-beta-galactosamide-alpha-2,3-sialyltransferase 1 [Lates calcarifer]
MVSTLRNTKVFFLLCISAFALFLSSSWDLSVYYLSLQNSSPCSCQKCLTDGDPCFRELITSSPKPFLSRKNAISEDIFKWWKGLQGEQRNFTFYNITIENLFKVIPPIPDLVEPSPNRCRTCAVVGNSGNLKGSNYGRLIDYHDIVIRMNRGRTKGYEADVGTKTTHHVMYPESATYLDSTTRLVLFPFKISDLLWLLKSVNPGQNGAAKSRRIANKDLVLILNPAVMKYVHETWLAKKGKYPSTGFLTLVLSMLICDEVSVFGFGADRDGNWNHYFEMLTDKKLRTGPHAGMHEYDVIMQLHKKKKIQFYTGW